MSSQNFHFSSSSSFSSYSTSSSNGQTRGHASRTESHSNPSGTTVKTTTQNLGERPVTETRTYDGQGRRLENGVQIDRRIEDVTDADKQYEERIEDEYTKREGGA